MRISKIKNLKNSILIEWETKEASGTVNFHMLESTERAKPSFYQALLKLRPFVILMCELADGYAETMRVSGVSLTEVGDSCLMGAKITAIKKLTKSDDVMNVITPFKSAKNPEDKKQNPKKIMPEKCLKAIGKLISEAEDYIKGEREQTKLDV